MGILGSLFKMNGYYIPYGMTPKERAQQLLSDIKYRANEINRSDTVYDFSYSYEKLSALSDELIWINEKKKVFMCPSPRGEWNRIQGNLSVTINAFIDRAINAIPRNGQSRLEGMQKIFDEIENDRTFSKLLKPENINKMSSLLASEEKKQKNQIESSLLARAGFEPNLDLFELDPMKVIEALEGNIEKLYFHFYTQAFSPDKGKEIFSGFKNACESSKLPLMAEVRLESLFENYAPKFESANPMSIVDHMEGHDFERWCANLLAKSGFANVAVTPGSGDQGVDITAEKDGVFYAIQCKCYSSDLGNKPVQEVYAGKEMYGCQVGVVMTNRYFTDGARILAKKTRVLLWDRDKLQELIRNSN